MKQRYYGFVGCIAGTVPALWEKQGKRERILLMLIIMVVTFVLAYLFYYAALNYLTASRSEFWNMADCRRIDWFGYDRPRIEPF